MNRRIVDQYIEDKKDDLKDLAAQLKEDYAKDAARVRTKVTNPSKFWGMVCKTNKMWCLNIIWSVDIL